MADLTPAGGAFTPNEPFDVELRGIDGTQLFNNDGSPMTISVLGADSDTAVKARNAQANRRIQAGPLKEVSGWLDQYRRFWEESFDRLDVYLEKIQASETKARGKKRGKKK